MLFNSTKRERENVCKRLYIFVFCIDKSMGIDTAISRTEAKKYSQKPLGHAIQSVTDVLKTASKRQNQKKVKATCDLKLKLKFLIKLEKPKKQITTK